jgi:hypothetical protein
MYLECLVMVTLKSPAFPSTFLISPWVTMVMFSCLPVATSFGEIMHMEQSLVGNVLSSWAMVPPMLAPDSSRYTLNPESARSRDACMPAGPPPTTSTAPTVLSPVTSLPPA